MFLKPTASVPSTVQLLKTPLVGVPSKGVVSVGDVANTNRPDPVSSVTAEAKFAEDGVPRNVATPVPREVMPVPPLPTGRDPVTWVVKLTPDNVPPRVKLPDVVTEPDNEMPLTVPVPATEVTVPVPGAAAAMV